jgi:hypothetical protein
MITKFPQSADVPSFTLHGQSWNDSLTRAVEQYAAAGHKVFITIRKARRHHPVQFQ